MVLESSIKAYGQCREPGTETWSCNCLSQRIGGVGRLEQKRDFGRVNHGLWTGTEAWTWNGLSRPMGVVRKTRAEAWFLERLVTVYGRCRETGTAASSWNGLSRSRDSVGILGQKHGLGTVYHGLRTM